MALMLLATTDHAAGQGWSLAPRAGVVVAGPLFEDAAVAGFAPVEVAPAPAPVLGLLGRTPLDGPWALEVELTWSPGTLSARTPEQNRELSDLTVIGGSVRLRRALGRVFGAVGVGGLSYRAPDARAYAEGSPLFPAGSLALSTALGIGRLQSHIEANLHVHRHQTPVLERAGADAALAWRAGLMIGIDLGGE
jgi:hypothetical protein